jgi:hypothetical protein
VFEGDAAVYARDHVPKTFLALVAAASWVVLGFEISISPVALGWTKSGDRGAVRATWVA